MAANQVQWFVRGDIDGFFGLFVDNLLQLMLIVILSGVVCGLPADLVVGRILPGCAISILIGNLFYAWQARRMMQITGRRDVTALPYGINTPSLFAYIFLIMGPIYRETNDPTLAWQAGLFACLLSGLMEIGGAFCGDWLRRHTPRAALLSALSGIAITFIAMPFVFQMFASPRLALVPAFIILVAYGSRLQLPLQLPGGLVAVVVGIVIAWILRAFGVADFAPPAMAPYSFGIHLPVPVPGDVLALVRSDYGWQYLAVVVPMGLFNVIGSLQNLESAEAAGDSFETRPSLLANGLGSVVAACFGSAFPTTIYIGHPGWKAMGARAGYSILNGVVVFALCLVGGITLVLQVVPLEATLGILLWIGIVITAQAFQEVPRRHALAVAIGLIPALGAWALLLIQTALRAAGVSFLAVVDKFGGDLYIHGLMALNQGFLLTSMILAAIMAHIIDHDLRQAAYWAFAAAALSMIGLIHAYELTAAGPANVFGLAAAPGFAVAYAAAGLLMLLQSSQPRPQDGDC